MENISKREQELINTIGYLLDYAWELNRDTGDLIYYNDIIEEVNELFDKKVLPLCDIENDEIIEYYKDNGMKTELKDFLKKIGEK